MVVRSAGLLLYRLGETGLEVLIGHMGGPFWARKHEHAWSIPKGEYDAGEDPLAAARREFAEELGSPPPDGDPIALGEIKQSNGKIVSAWAIAGDFDPATAVSNTFTMEWPRGSGAMQEFPEIDKVAWCDLATARTLLVAGRVEFLDRLAAYLAEPD
jgi:predicted NUDIX family NTP pyrophosphohydrolase